MPREAQPPGAGAAPPSVPVHLRGTSFGHEQAHPARGAGRALDHLHPSVETSAQVRVFFLFSCFLSKSSPIWEGFHPLLPPPSLYQARTFRRCTRSPPGKSKRGT